MARCDVESLHIKCILPTLPTSNYNFTLPTAANLELSLDVIEWTQGTLVPLIYYVSFADWASESNYTNGDGASATGTDNALEEVMHFSTTPAPGIPSSVASGNHATSMVAKIIYITCGIVGLTLILGFILLLVPCLEKRCRHTLCWFDALFVVQTNNNNSNTDSSSSHGIDSDGDSSGNADRVVPMLRASSAEGGIFTFITIIFVIGILSAYLAQVWIDNTLVLTSIDPRPTNYLVHSNFKAEVTFHHAREFSMDTFNNNNNNGTFDCLDWFNIEVTGFASSTGTGTKNSVQGDTSCRFMLEETGTVIVEWSCSNQCYQSLSSSNVSINVPSPNAFVRSLEWSFSSTDYFGDESKAIGHMFADDTFSYFKGAPQSLVQLSTLSTNYTDGVKDTKTGKLVKVLAAQPGAQVRDQTFNTGTGVGFQFIVNSAPDWFLIQLTQKQTTLSILAQVMAIIGGVLSMGRLSLALYFYIFKRKGNTNGTEGTKNSPYRVHPKQSQRQLELSEIV